MDWEGDEEGHEERPLGSRTRNPNSETKRCHFIFLAAVLGTFACIKLNQLVEAIKWCEEGLAVSF